MLEKVPCASMLVRIHQAPTNTKGEVLSIKNVMANEYLSLGVVKQAPLYEDQAYNT